MGNTGVPPSFWNVADKMADNMPDRSFDNSSATVSGFRWFLVTGLLLVMLTGTGCRSNRVQWNLFNWQHLDRVPPPATGSLSLPGTSTSGYPTSTIPAPPTTLPSSNGLPNVSPPGYPSGTGNWSSGQTPSLPPGSNVNPPGTLSAIPGRDASAGWAVPNASGLYNPNEVAAVPPMLNEANFDPFSTDRIPAWNPDTFAGPTHPLLNTSPTASSGNGQVGWWPHQTQNQSDFANPGPGFGNGQVLGSMNRSIQGFFQQEPANLGGFQTTAPIQNPMIAATGNGYMPATGVPPSQFPTSPNPQVNAEAWARYQQQQLEALRVRQMQQLQAAAAANPSFGTGSGQMQVLAESSTSNIAENQSRQGIRSAAMLRDPRYSGQTPQGSATLAR